MSSGTGGANVHNSPSCHVPVSSQTAGGATNSQETESYTIPRVLNFLHHEWSKFDSERSQWDAERAELNARIAFLQGERNGQENVKDNLIRRIKMLEYALRQERAKCQKLISSCDKISANRNADRISPLEAATTEDVDEATAAAAVRELLGIDSIKSAEMFSTTKDSGETWRQGRQLLRQYLQELGYTDTFLDMKSNSVCSLLGLRNLAVMPECTANEKDNGEDNRKGSKAKQAISLSREQESTIIKSLLDRSNLGRTLDAALTNGSVACGDDSSASAEGNMDADKLIDGDQLDKEAAVVANFDFLSPESDALRLRNDNGECCTDSSDGNNDDIRMTDNGRIQDTVTDGSFCSSSSSSSSSEDEHVTNSIVSRPSRPVVSVVSVKTSSRSSNESRSDSTVKKGKHRDCVAKLKARNVGASQQTETSIYQTALELGELGALQVDDNSSSVYSRPLNTGRTDSLAGQKRSTDIAVGSSLPSIPRLTLNNHLDCVRSMAFHPTLPYLITASDDATLKLWPLHIVNQRSSGQALPVKASTVSHADVEPVYTFRGHCGAVVTCCISENGGRMFSGGSDGHICVWNLHSIIQSSCPSAVSDATCESSTIASSISSHDDIYAVYDPDVLLSRFVAVGERVTDVISRLVVASFRDDEEDIKMLLMSLTSSGQVKLWQHYMPCKSETQSDSANGTKRFDVPCGERAAISVDHDLLDRPTCITWLPSTTPAEPPSKDLDSKSCYKRLAAIGCMAGHTTVFTVYSDLDLQPRPVGVCKINASDSADNNELRAVTCLVAHTTLSLLICGYADRHVRLYDFSTLAMLMDSDRSNSNSGAPADLSLVRSMVAHVDVLTSVSLSPNGSFLATASHDCSLRVWDVLSGKCIQDVSSHRKKFDEGLLDVKFHPKLAYLASAGADSLVKVFV